MRTTSVVARGLSPNEFSLTGSPLECSSLVVAEGASLLPGAVSAAVSPPACLAVIGAGGVEGLDFTAKDAYGNGYFVNPRLNRLYFGKPVRGFVLAIW